MPDFFILFNIMAIINLSNNFYFFSFYLLPLFKKYIIIIFVNYESNFCHAACWFCATERCEPCQAGNRAALNGMPVRYSSPARRVTEVGLFV